MRMRKVITSRSTCWTLLGALMPCLLPWLTATAWGQAATELTRPAAAESGESHHRVPLQPVRYNNPGLVVDLEVGLWAWPLPIDFDQDGDLDLVVASPDKPYNGTYFFENPGRSDSSPGAAAGARTSTDKLPIFKPARRISRGLQNVQISYVAGQPRVLTPGREHHEFLTRGLDSSRPLPVPENFHQTTGPFSNKTRANQWKYCDFDGDGAEDLIVGVGDWSHYGWDDAFDSAGDWTHGPLHGFVYWIRNSGHDSAGSATYDPPVLVAAAGQPIDVYGWPSPNFADFDGDGDLDLICGEFLDKFTYFENVGTRSAPTYAAGRRLEHRGQLLAMDLQMIVPSAIDWDRDGDVDLIVGDEDGRVALVEHTGRVTGGLPDFLPPVYFQQQADRVACGALATPCSVDWDNDGDEDILCGNTAGYLLFVENLGTDDAAGPPRWAAARRLTAAGEVIRIQAGPNGSIQGPCEAKWGYTTLTVGDWDHDGLHDLVLNSIWGKVVWYRNQGSAHRPELAAAQPLQVAWPAAPPKPAWNWWTPAAQELVTQWRTTPVVVDWNRDGLNDLIMLDHEGYLALYRRTRTAGELQLQPGERIFVTREGEPWRLNERTAGGSGRRKLCVVDWDRDGRLDLLVNSKNADLLKNVGELNGRTVLVDQGALSEQDISSHTTSPTTCDWNRDGVPELLIGAEDGFLYHGSPSQLIEPAWRQSRGGGRHTYELKR